VSFIAGGFIGRCTGAMHHAHPLAGYDFAVPRCSRPTGCWLGPSDELALASSLLFPSKYTIVLIIVFQLINFLRIVNSGYFGAITNDAFITEQ